MLFKGVGVILLLMVAYLAVRTFVLVPNDGRLGAEVYVLVAIFLALTVRVLQAERHHRG